MNNLINEISSLCESLFDPKDILGSLYDKKSKDADDIYKININGETVDILTEEGHKKFVDFVNKNKVNPDNFGSGLSAYCDLINSALDDTLELVNKRYEEHQKELANCKACESCSSCDSERPCYCDTSDIALDITEETRDNFDKIIDSYFATYPHKLALVDSIDAQSLRNRLRHFLGYVYNV